MAAFRVTFSRVLFGVSFPVASIDIFHARDAERAMRAAELRFMRRSGLDSWHYRADTIEITPAVTLGPEPSG
jgi:1,2-phenylacetyl-CoA epoxidase PaaB subunit